MGNLSENKEEVICLYKQGISCSAIAKRYGVVTAAVTQMLNRMGVRAIAKGTLTILDDAKSAELSRLYAAGEPSGKLCKEFNINQCTVREIAKRHGIKIRGVGDHRKIFDADSRIDIVSRYNHGDLPANIAKDYGTCRSIIVSVLVSEGKISGRRKKSPERHTDGNGYWLVKLPINDPMAEMRYGNGYVPEHRLIMARSLDRPLLSSETVHHIDGNPSNNDISNLQLRQGRHGKNQCYACADCGSRNIKPIPIDESKTA